MSSPRPSESFQLEASFEPKGDQPAAIERLADGIQRDQTHQVLLGVTGSGKTFTMAHVIAKVQRPTLVLAHNKTLAAQLYQELKSFFPKNAVEYFVSYYDYYQPEAYVPATDTFIEKDSQINDAIDRLRHAATRALLERNDVIIVASVSCIYGIGSRDSYSEMTAYLEVGRQVGRDAFLRQLVESQYERNDFSFHRGTFRVRGDIVEIFPAHEEEKALRVSFFGDEVDDITEIDPLRGRALGRLDHVTIWPASHYATSRERRDKALIAIRDEFRESLQALKKEERLVEAQRLEQRITFDLEMLETTGACKGIENYSRHLSGRAEGEPPPTLLDYFPRDFLLVIDESHQTVPQVRAMYRGDRARKETLVRYGFRLPSALDNRPLNFDEFVSHIDRAVYVSATPGDYEIECSEGEVVEQLIRPTGLLDPIVEMSPIATQVDDVIEEARQTVAKNGRVLITTLTKRMAEDLTEYLQEVGLKASYLHSDIDTLARVETLRLLRSGEIDVLVGINLLREGLDLPEVAFVGILDADKEGFLRSATGLIQTIGRAARNAQGRVVLYADRVTDSMRHAVDETNRRRAIQEAYNAEHGIVPQTIVKDIRDMGIDAEEDREKSAKRQSRAQKHRESAESLWKTGVAPSALLRKIEEMRKQMHEAAAQLDFEDAALLRDEIRQLEAHLLSVE